MSQSSFKPAWWLPNSHLQTLWPVLCKRSIKIPLKRERIDLPDGDFIDLDWSPAENPDSPLILMLHGLEGSIESHYAKSMLLQFMGRGWRGVFMHFRGCSGEHNRLTRTYHSGDTEDVAFVVQALKKREPKLQLAAIGYSLGGNVLLKWLGETGADNLLRAAIAISVPFELHKAASRIQKGFSKFYQWYFIQCLRQRFAKKFKSTTSPKDGPGFDLQLIHQVSTMYDWDDKITAPLHGFSGVLEYYTTASSRQYLRHIEVPTLILHAKDDPFMSEDVIPEPHELSKCVQLEITETGGHVGFVTGKYPWKPKYWLEERVPEFFCEHFQSS